MGSGAWKSAPLYYTCILLYTSFAISGSEVRRYSMSEPAVLDKFLQLYCILVLIWRLRHQILAQSLVWLWRTSMNVLMSFHVASKIHVFQRVACLYGSRVASHIL